MTGFNKIQTVLNLLKNKKILVVLVVIVVSVAGVWVANSRYGEGRDIVFTVQDEKYRKEEVGKFIRFLVERRGLSEDDAAKSMMLDIKKIKTAQALGVEPSQEQIALQKSILLDGLTKKDKTEKDYELWFELQAKKNAIDAYVGNNYKLGYKGYNYVFYFGQHLQYGYGPKPAGIDDPELVAQDKKNAQERAEYYHKSIESGADPKQVLERVLSDPKIVTSQDLTLKQSSKFGFDPNISWYEDIIPDPIKKFVNEQSETGLSSIQTGKGAQTLEDSEDKFVETYYYFIYLDEADKSNSASSSQLNNQISKIKTEYRGFD